MSHSVCGEKVILIAHRGNIHGPNIEKENHPDYIDTALSLGYDVEVDVRGDITEGFYLGHDEKQYEVDPLWFFQRSARLWIHCKDLPSLHFFLKFDKSFNSFWHQEDYYTLTTKNFIWTYPGHILSEKSICVMPEYADEPYTLVTLQHCAGICTDYVEKYK